jgi:hypothetical protein
LSTGGITSILLSQIASSPSSANQFATDLNQLAQDLKGDNLSAAQQDYVTLSQDALDGVTSSAATTSTSGITTSLLSGVVSSSANSNSFVNELNQLGSDLSNGDLTSAQGDMLSLESVALSGAPASSAPSSTSSSASNPNDISALVRATVDAMAAGDDSTISADMSELASISASPGGASYLESASQSYSSGTSSTSSLGSLSQVLQNLNSDSSSSSDSLLSLLA